MRVVEGFHVRQILDEVIAVPTGDAGKVFSGIISLNEIGRFLFDVLRQEQTEETLVQAVLDEYEVDAGTARADVREFTERLRSAGLLIE